jgi:Tfp pilus assembly PilM family ATPase
MSTLIRMTFLSRFQIIISRKTNSSDENITNVILRSNETDKSDDPVIILSVLQPDEYQIISIQLLSNARHIEVKKILDFFLIKYRFFSKVVLSSRIYR